jgi:hypothetical protein
LQRLDHARCVLAYTIFVKPLKLALKKTVWQGKRLVGQFSESSDKEVLPMVQFLRDVIASTIGNVLAALINRLLNR